MIDWSHELLSAPERLLFRRLSVFAGGWTPEAAQAVCAADGLHPERVLGLLTQLVQKSLVVLDTQAAAPRYRLLETIRQYARDKLVESADVITAPERHLEHQLAFATAAQPLFYRQDQSRAYAAVDVELANIRAALDWSLAKGAADRGLLLVQALHRYWVARLFWREAVDWTLRLLAAKPPQPRDLLRASALLAAGHIANYFDPAGAQRLVTVSLDLFRTLDDRAGTASALWVAGWIESRHLDGRAVGYFEESICLALAVDSAIAAVHAYAWYGAYRVAMGQYALARPLLRAGIEWAQRLGGDATLIGRCEGNLAQAEMLEGHFEQARAHLARSHALAIQADNDNGIAESWWLLGRLAHCERDFERAIACFGKSLAVYSPYATSVWVTRALAYLMIVHACAGCAELATQLAAHLAARCGSIEDLSAELGSVAAIADHQAAIVALRQGCPSATFERSWNQGLGWSDKQAASAALAAPTAARD